MSQKQESRTEVPLPKAIHRIVRLLLIVLLSLIVIYVAVSAVAANLLTTPVREFSLRIARLRSLPVYQNIRFLARGGDVEIMGWYFLHANSQRAIILVHGKDCSRIKEFYGRFIDLAAAIHRNGFNVLMIDLRGHGQSGDAHCSFGLNERRDVEGAVSWLMKQGFKPGTIGVLGVSMGAAASIGAAANDPNIGTLVVDSGFASIYPIIQKEWSSASGLPDCFFPSSLFMVRLMFGYDICAARPVDEIGRIAPRPILIIHSTSDELVPVNHAKQLKASAPFAETWIVTGPEHARIYNANPLLYSQKVIDFFHRSLK